MITVIKSAESIFEKNQQIEKLQKELSLLQKEYKIDLEDYLKEYFNGEIPKVLPLSKNQFITDLRANSFSLAEDARGNVYWIARSYLATVRDGQVTYGHSHKEIYQGTYEKYSPQLKAHTIKNAIELTTPAFPVVSRDFQGVAYANIGYELARNEDLGIILVWRKGATAYIDRSTGSVTSQASLQVIALNGQYKKIRPQNLKNYQNNPTNTPEVNKVLRGIEVSMHVVDIHEGGRLNKEVILKNTDTINTLFGSGTTTKIVQKVEQHNKRKSLSKEIRETQEEVQTPSVSPSSEEIVVGGRILRI